MLVLWLGAGAMALTALFCFSRALQRKPSQRKFEAYCFFIAFIGTISYLSLATGYGFIDFKGERIPYARYLDWAITTPMILWTLLQLCGSPDYEMVLGCGVTMIVLEFIASLLLTQGSRWIFFGLSIFCLAYICSVLSSNLRARRFGKEASVLYATCAWVTLLSWSVYPVTWILYNGLGAIGNSTTALLYLISDLLAKAL